MKHWDLYHTHEAQENHSAVFCFVLCFLREGGGGGGGRFGFLLPVDRPRGDD